ncbi:glycosyltransferase family 39 protein [Solitalea sp. MAHUQ-68]|uniref:Glycosyltransferase family 39 protein n=1 Tax=Solitalea agri TaxID=2953739 RepID=A0A9X2F3K9_9SPHI|nr:glycosyltransferase family 39 protein [Solitalea agri]MCO4293616.1 glycosyltransferase family 39 protein [Solitalea agri]
MNQPITKSTYLFLFTICCIVYLLGSLVKHNTIDLNQVICFTFSALAAYSTFRLAQALYNKETGQLAALIFVTSQAIIFSIGSIKADTILTGSIILGTWQLVEFIKSKKLVNLIILFLAITLGVIIQGPITAVIIGSAIGCNLLYSDKWKILSNWKWLSGLLLFLGALTVVYFCPLPAAIKNILFLENSSSQELSASFNFSFFYTLLWTLFPWSILVFIALTSNCKAFWNAKFKPNSNIDLLALGGIFIGFLYLLATQFKSPQYLIVLSPFTAILLASFLYKQVQLQNWKMLAKLEKIQLLVIGLLILICLLVNVWFFPIQNFAIEIVSVISLSVLFFIVLRGNRQGYLYRIIAPSAFAILAAIFLASTSFYPQLLTYQADYKMALLAKEQAIPADQIYTYTPTVSAFNNQSNDEVPKLNPEQIQDKIHKNNKFYLFISNENINDLIALKLPIKRQLEIPHYAGSLLNIEFLNPLTRSKTLKKGYLLEIN